MKPFLAKGSFSFWRSKNYPSSTKNFVLPRFSHIFTKNTRAFYIKCLFSFHFPVHLQRKYNRKIQAGLTRRASENNNLRPLPDGQKWQSRAAAGQAEIAISGRHRTGGNSTPGPRPGRRPMPPAALDRGTSSIYDDSRAKSAAGPWQAYLRNHSYFAARQNRIRSTITKK